MRTAPDPEFDAVLAAAREGDEVAWRRIHASLAGPLLTYARGHGAYEPEDVVSEVFVDVARGLARFRGGEDAFRGWVFLVARHRMIDERRRRARRPVDPEEQAALELLASASDVADEALARVEAVRVLALLEALTPDQRDVLMLRVVADLSVEETARILGKRRGAVKQMQHRALAALRRTLSEQGVTG